MPLEEEEQEISLLDILNTLWRRKIMIILLTFLFAVASLIYAFTRPLIYRAECRILPPSSNSGRLAGFSALGGFADMVGLPVNSTTGQMLIGIMQGDSFIDTIVDKFNIMEEMSTDIRLIARTAVLGGLDAAESPRSGIISVAYMSTDPARAAEMANAFVEELQKKLQSLSLSDAQQRRNFFDRQLTQANQELEAAEDAMIAYQQSKGVVAFESQSQALLSSINSLRNQIAAKNIQISTLRSYLRPDNPRLKTAQSELDAMTKELRRLEEEQRRSDTSVGRIGDSGEETSLSVGQIPELGIEYQRYVRALRFATAKYELMLRQYENARLSEANDLSTISIIDPAIVPDSNYLPRRGRIVILGTGAGAFLGIFLAFLLDHIQSIVASREKYYDEEDDA